MQTKARGRRHHVPQAHQHLALTEAQQQTRLSDARVSNQKELEQEIAEHTKGGNHRSRGAYTGGPQWPSHTQNDFCAERRRFAGVCSQSHSLFAHSENAFVTRQGSTTGDTKKNITDKLGL